MKRSAPFVLLALLAVFAVIDLGRSPDSNGIAEAKAVNAFCVEGTWVLRLPDGRFSRETIIAGHNGQTAHFTTNDVLPGDATLGGLFPDAVFAPPPGPGSARRIGPSTFEFQTLGYAVNVIGGVPSEIAYIQISEGVVDLPDCDTQEFTLTQLFFLPEQDADGDGLPDEGEDPFLVVPNLSGTGTKFFP